MTMDTICSIIMERCTDPYARTYAQAWLDGRVAERAAELGEPLGKAKATQAAYILSNLDGWHGITAETIRRYLKQIAEGRRHD